MGMEVVCLDSPAEFPADTADIVEEQDVTFQQAENLVEVVKKVEAVLESKIQKETEEEGLVDATEATAASSFEAMVIEKSPEPAAEHDSDYVPGPEPGHPVRMRQRKRKRVTRKRK